MGILVALSGMVLFIPLVLFAVLCMNNIVAADSLVAALICAALLRTMLHLHPVLCILAGCLVFAGVSYLFVQERGQRFLSLAVSAVCAYLGGFIAYDLTKGDVLWTWFAAALAGIIIYSLHLHAGFGITRPYH